MKSPKEPSKRASSTHMLEFVFRSYHNYNALALKCALVDYYEHIAAGGKMFLAMAGAMSTARLGIHLAPAIREGLVHGMSTTGANLEESLFWAVAAKHYKVFPNYRFHSRRDEEQILKAGLRRVTTTTIPEEEAFRMVEKVILPLWKKGVPRFWHHYFYDLVRDTGLQKKFQSSPDECWLLAAAELQLPMVVPGYADSTFGNIFSGYCFQRLCTPAAAKSDIEQFKNFYRTYNALSEGKGCGFFQIGGGIAGDFPICVVPSIKYDLMEKVKPWQYFCQVSDAVCSYGGYSGATPNEKITWDKVRPETPMHVVESDATIVMPIMFAALLEAKRNPRVALGLISEFKRDLSARDFWAELKKKRQASMAAELSAHAM